MGGLLLGVTFGGAKASLFRPLRVLRVARMGRFVPDELIRMIHGVQRAWRGVFSALLLLIILIYIFAIILHSLLDGNEATEKYFTGLQTVMLTLLLDGTFLDGIGTVTRLLLEDTQFVAFCIFIIFVAGSALTVMNMLIGVLCEVVSQTSAAEKEEADVDLMKKTLLVMLQAKDADGSGLLEMEEMCEVFADPNARAVLESMNVDTENVMDVGRLLKTHFGAVSIGMVMELMLAARGGRSLTMKDLINSNQFLYWKLERKLDEIVKH